jgi:hypothetical protein
MSDGFDKTGEAYRRGIPQAPCDRCGKSLDEHARLHICPGRKLIPRVAESQNDLVAGQWAAWVTYSGAWEICRIQTPDLWSADYFKRGVVILSDPPPEPVRVSRQAIDRLDQAARFSPGDVPAAAQALLREVKESAI